jgi:hypothetical protein
MTEPRPSVVETKVKTTAVTAATTAGVLSLLSVYVFRGQAVPDALNVMVTTVVGTVVAGAVTFVVGWLTRHTPREVFRIDERPGA